MGKKHYIRNAKKMDKSTEKRKLFCLLKAFFMSSGNTPEIMALLSLYESAMDNDTDETYFHLVEAIHSFSMTIPGVTIETSSTEKVDHRMVKFFESRDDYSESSGMEVLNTKPVNQFIVRFMEPKKKMTNSNQIEVLHEDIKQRFDKYGNDIEDLGIRVNYILGEGVKGAIEDDKRQSYLVIENIKDSFTFIMVDPLSLPGFLGLFVFLAQIASFSLAVSYLYLDHERISEYDNSNPLGLPKGAGVAVHSGQGVALPLILLVQQSFWEATSSLCHGFNTSLKTQGIQYGWWTLSNCLRLSEALVATFVTFMLVLRSDNVVDLFKDFTAITFVSSFDNIVYMLAKMNVIGKTLKKAVIKCETVKYEVGPYNNVPEVSSVCSARKRFATKNLIRPGFFALSILTGMYIIWIHQILIPHKNGKYLCQKIYVQLDDKVNSHLSYFSGSYMLSSGSKKSGMYPTYRESKPYLKKKNESEMILRFCLNVGWVFILDKDDEKYGCLEDHAVAKSGFMINQQKYDVFEVPSDDWFVMDKDSGRWMPLESFRIGCEDNSPQYSLDKLGACESLEIDDREEQFISTRVWSRIFTIVKQESREILLINDHPVYTSMKGDYEVEQEIIIYVGKRWILTSTNDLADYMEMKLDGFLTDLRSYLASHFHPRWSDYEVAFFSEPIEIDTPQDSMTPVGLNWVISSPKIPGELQFADDKREISSVFLCSKCNNSTNKCFYQGVCLSDHSCECSTGSSGVLCQIIPSGNGFCNVYFNSRKFEYDGGDCCIDTCTSSDKYDCGKDENGFFHVGYDNCETETCTNCWRESKFQSSFSEMIVADISVSENGQILALIETVGRSVRVYDNHGKNWVMRGAALTNVENIKTDRVQISGPNFVSNKRTFSPVTVVILIDGSIQIFEWDTTQWERHPFQMTNTTIRHLALRNDGYTLGILYEGSTQNNMDFKLFKRPQNSMAWKEIYNPHGNFRSMSLSQDGDKVALASTKCLELHNSTMMIAKNCTLFNNDIMKVQISSGGTILSILVNHFGFKGDIYIYDIRRNTLEQTFDVLRGVSSSAMTMEVSDDGKKIITLSRLNKMLHFHSWKDSVWKMNQDTIFAKTMSLSSRNTVLVAISAKQSVGFESSDSVVVYHKNQYCDLGMSKVRFTFIPDNFPLELHYEIVNITWSDADLIDRIEVLRKVRQNSKTGATIVEEMCIDDKIITSRKDNMMLNNCIGIRVFDLGLEGLKYPGIIGVSVNGKVIFSVNSTDGYEQTFSILGNTKCMEMQKRNTISNQTISFRHKKYNVKLHHECSSEECSWTKTGEIYKGKPAEPYSFRSLSADGLVLAFGNSSVKNSTRIVSVFEYDGSDWIPRGLNITGIDMNGSFSQSVSLSADGSIVVIGDLNSKIPGTSKVLVYRYEWKNQNWYQYGSTITESKIQKAGSIVNTTADFGYFVDISADGSIIAVGLKGTFNDPFCLAFVFKYNAKTDDWDEVGDCIPSTIGQHRSVVKISSNGLTVAIGNAWHDNLYGDESILGYIQDPEYSRNIGRVSVFEYDNESNRWKEKGDVIEGDKLFGLWGFSIDISSDGLILAVGGVLDVPTKVYKYNDDKKIWENMGQELSIIKDDSNNLDDVNTVAVALSSSGSVITLSYDRYTLVYLFDELWGTWSQGITRVPSFNFTNKNPSIAVSADSTKMAIEGDNKLHLIYLKILEGFNCKKEDSLFNLTIQPDLFPKDITWTLQSKGSNIFGTRLTEDKNQNIETLMYTKCIPEHEIYTFVIEDHYGDGICCNWGDGSFTLEWNGKKVMDSTNFTSTKTLCMPQSLDLSFFSIDFNLEEEETLDPSINWFLLDSKQNILNNDRIPFQCIPSNECISLVIIDTYAADSSFTSAKVMTDDKVILYLREPGFSFHRAVLGCDETKCPEGSNLFEMQLFTDATVKELSWELKDVYKNKTLANGKNYEEAFMYYYFSDCIPANLEDCLELEIKQPSYGRNNFQLSLDRQIIVNAANWTDSSIQKQLFGNCQTCQKNEELFELNLVTDDHFPDQFSWELVDSNHSIIANGGHHKEKQTFFHYGTCISQKHNECLTLRLFDTSGNGNTFYVVILDGYIIVEQNHSISMDKIKIGKCSISCPMNHNFFELDLLISDHPEDISWELADSNGTILALRNKFTNTKMHHYYGKCILVPHNECTTLRLHDNGMLNDGRRRKISVGSTNYIVSWDGVIIDENGMVGNSHEIMMNCCPQNQTRFELDFVTDYWPEEFSWSLLDVNDTIVASNEMHVSYGNTQQYYGECVTATPNECLRVELIDFGGDGGTEYRIKWDGNVIEDDKHVSGVSDIGLGSCGVVGSGCPNQQTLFELNFVTDTFPCDFSWKLVGGDDSVLASGDGYSKYDKQYELKECVSASLSECVTLHLFDYYGDGGTKYKVKWDGNVIEEGDHASSNLEITMGNCEIVPQPECLEDQSLFELSFVTDNNPSDFSWKLIDSGNEVIASGGHYIVAQQQHVHDECIFVSTGDCLILHMLDSHGDGGTKAVVKWDGNVMSDDVHESVNATTIKLNC